MSEVMRDSAIKLFGKTIPLPFADKSSDGSLSQLRHTTTSCSSQDTKDESEYESSVKATSSEMSEDPETEKTLVKKAETKMIPCPRCDSMETKFCYYNNYNVKQPRYFCKNCQRYWTSGGTMRNVPVGSGRRKTKAPSSGAEANAGFVVGFYPAALFWGGMGSAYSVLGKHSREENKAEAGRVLIPKTLRIDDPREAAKSSIWSTLGIKNDASRFKVFAPPRMDRRAMALQANPAALSRSLNFHEAA